MVDKPELNEQTLIAMLRAIVATEGEVFAKLDTLEQKPSADEPPARIFNEKEIRAFQPILERHLSLVKQLEKCQSSPHMSSPTLENIRDAVKEVAAIYYSDGDAIPKNPIIAKFYEIREALLHRKDLLRSSSREMHQDTILRTRNAERAEESVKLVDQFRDEEMKAFDNMRSNEPGISARAIWDCASNCKTLENRLKELYADRWYRNVSPIHTAEKQ